MDDLSAWRNRGLSNPADIIEYKEAGQAKKKLGCFSCCHRPKLIGGNGYCKTNKKSYRCGYLQDEKVTG